MSGSWEKETVLVPFPVAAHTTTQLLEFDGLRFSRLMSCDSLDSLKLFLIMSNLNGKEKSEFKERTRAQN